MAMGRIRGKSVLAWGGLLLLCIYLALLTKGAYLSGVVSVWPQGSSGIPAGARQQQQQPLTEASADASRVSSFVPPDADQCCHAAGVPVTSRQSVPQRMAFLIGAQKSGTTFLFNELVTRHPHIKGPAKGVFTRQKARNISMKEPHYFDRVPLGNFDEYLGMFKEAGNASYTYLDGTPDYIHIPSAACRIAAAFPKAKLVVVLKDPVQRALSGWNMVRHQRRAGLRDFAQEVALELAALRSHNCSFEPPEVAAAAAAAAAADALAAAARGGHSTSVWRKALLPERKLLAALPGSSSSSNSSSSSDSSSSSSRGAAAAAPAAAAWQRAPGLRSWNECFRCTFSYCSGYRGPTNGGVCRQDLGRGFLKRGLYVYQLEWWLKHFPPEQLLVINYEQMNSDRDGVLDRIMTFLGHDPKLKRGKEANQMPEFRLPHYNNTAVYAKAIEDLYRFYADANEELYRLMASLGPAPGWVGTFPTSSKQQ